MAAKFWVWLLRFTRKQAPQAAWLGARLFAPPLGLQETIGQAAGPSTVETARLPCDGPVAFSSLYDDLHRPLGTNVSITPTYCAGVKRRLDASWNFDSSPPGTQIREGSKLLSACRVDLHCLEDLLRVPVSTKRIWMRVSDPSSSRRRISEMSKETLQFFEYVSSVEWRPRPLRLPQLAPVVESAADAFGKASTCGIGGWLRFPNGHLTHAS